MLLMSKTRAAVEGVQERRGVFVFVLCFLLQVLLAKTREAATPMYPKNAPEDGHKSVTVCKMISMVVCRKGAKE